MYTVRVIAAEKAATIIIIHGITTVRIGKRHTVNWKVRVEQSNIAGVKQLDINQVEKARCMAQNRSRRALPGCSATTTARRPIARAIAPRVARATSCATPVSGGRCLGYHSNKYFPNF